MTDKQLLEQALEALEHMLEDAKQERVTVEYWNECVDAITAIKQALEAPVQEPVANASTWFALVMNAAAELEDASHCLRDEDAKRVAISGAKHYRDAAKALYTTPPAAPVRQHAEQLAKLGWQYFECPACGSEGAKAFAKPPAAPEQQADQEIQALTSLGGKLALELECLLLECNDTAATSKWWNSAQAALEDWRSYLWQVSHGDNHVSPLGKD